MDSDPPKNKDGGWTVKKARPWKPYQGRRDVQGESQYRGRGKFRGHSKRGFVQAKGEGLKTPPLTNSGPPPPAAPAALKPSFKAVVCDEIKAEVPDWVLCTKGDLAKQQLSREAASLPKARLITIVVNGIHHNIDVLRLSPLCAASIRQVQNEIKGIITPPLVKLNLSNEAVSFKSASTSFQSGACLNPVASSSKGSSLESTRASTSDPEQIIACPTCGFKVAKEKVVPDVSKLSGRKSARKYLNYRISSSRKATEKLEKSLADLEERFVQQDEVARLKDLASAAVKAKHAEVESEKQKSRVIHYQDPMDLDKEEQDVKPREVVVVGTATPIQVGVSVGITTAQSQDIRLLHTGKGKRTAPIQQKVSNKRQQSCAPTPQPPAPFVFPFPPPTVSEDILGKLFAMFASQMAELRGEINSLKVVPPPSTGPTPPLIDLLTSEVGSNLNISGSESFVGTSILEPILLTPTEAGTSSSSVVTTEAILDSIDNCVQESDAEMEDEHLLSDTDEDEDLLRCHPIHFDWADDE